MSKRPYDNTKRRQAAILRAALKATEPAPKIRPRRHKKLSAEERYALVPPDKICPTCGDVVPEMNKWVVGQAYRRGMSAECKVCWFSRINVGDLPPESQPEPVKQLVKLPIIPPTSPIAEFVRIMTESDDKPIPPAEPQPEIDSASF